MTSSVVVVVSLTCASLSARHERLVERPEQTYNIIFDGASGLPNESLCEGGFDNQSIHRGSLHWRSCSGLAELWLSRPKYSTSRRRKKDWLLSASHIHRATGSIAQGHGNQCKYIIARRSQGI